MRIHASSIALLLLIACGGGGGSPAPGEPFGLADRQSNQGLQFPIGIPQPGALTPVRAFPNLGFSRPVKITHAGDGTDRLFVVEQEGRIRVFDNDPGATSSTLFLDITDRVSRASNEEGLLGLAFDPRFSVNGHFYVYYSAAGPRRSVIARFTATGNDADESSEFILRTIAQPFGNHNGGDLAFGPDELLYVSCGDGGSGGDPQNHGQNLDTFLGTILRMRTNGGPADTNPFYTGAGGARDYIWAYGLRNPWRMSFDRVTDELWTGDVGQNAYEEIDIVERGGNYGWRIREGDSDFDNPTSRPASDFIGPVQTYGRSLGTSVTGGYVYRGNALRSLYGAYLYADFVSGRVWALVMNGDTVASNTQVATVQNPSSFGEDEAGELYVCSFNGSIYRFEEQGSPPPAGPIPDRLSQTGLFSSLAPLTPSAGLVPYDVNAPLWSDGATKRRWIALPDDRAIGFAETGAWTFPLGTVIVKHFDLSTAPGVVASVETRVLVHERRGWRGYSYRWNEAGTEANLIDDAETREFTIQEPGGPRLQTWTYPSRDDCLRCHTAAAGFVLGVRTVQLNRAFDYGAASDNQLRTWEHIGMFDGPVPAPSQLSALAMPADTSAPLDDRARAYLDSNCSSCHLPAGPTAVNMDLRWSVAESAMELFGVVPSDGSLGLLNERRAVAGVKESSTLWERMRLRDDKAMPPLGSHVLDAFGVDLIGDWIDSK